MTRQEEAPLTPRPKYNRIVEIVESKAPEGHWDGATRRVIKAVAEWEPEARERAREVTRSMFAGLMPGSTGINMANEVADKILEAILRPEVPKRLTDPVVDLAYQKLRRRLNHLAIPAAAPLVEMLDLVVPEGDFEAVRAAARPWDGFVRRDLLSLAEKIEKARTSADPKGEGEA